MITMLSGNHIAFDRDVFMAAIFVNFFGKYKVLLSTHKVLDEMPMRMADCCKLMGSSEL